MKFEAARIHFLNDVFVAVAVVGVYKLPVGFLGRKANLFQKVKKNKTKQKKHASKISGLEWTWAKACFFLPVVLSQLLRNGEKIYRKACYTCRVA